MVLGTERLLVEEAAVLVSVWLERRRAKGFISACNDASELSRRSDARQPGEVGTLATAINTMADSIQRLLGQGSKDKAELLTILAFALVIGPLVFLHEMGHDNDAVLYEIKLCEARKATVCMM